MASLRFVSGPNTGEIVALDKPRLIFGRHPASDCVLNHKTVSREHFVVERNGHKYFAVDRNSGNGTYVNGSRITWVELNHGDRIQAGPFAFVVEMEKTDRKVISQQGENEFLTSEHLRVFPRGYLEGIAHFNAGRYYDAHEVWEEVWLRTTGQERLFYQMLIQAAVALYHYGRGNIRGARGLYEAVLAKLSKLPPMFMSLDLTDFQEQLRSYLAPLEVDDTSNRGTGIAAPVIRPLCEK